MKKAVLIWLMITVSVVAIATERISGSWNGTLSIGAQQLRLVFNIQGDSCTLDSPDQAAMGIPATIKHCSADSLIIEIPALKVVYEGSLDGNRIEGTFTQNGYAMPLTLKAGKIIFNRPQTPQPPFDYRTREVTFTNPADNAVLSGTLTYPSDYKKGKTPVVLMVTGSGQQNRNEEIFEHRPFAVIADYFAQHGIASLRYDDRGFNKSTGDVSSATTATFARDAEAGLEYLRNLKEFGKIGVLGHSEGGTISFILAGEGKTDFIVSLAGSALRGDKVLVEQNRLKLSAMGLPDQMTDDYCNALTKLYEYKIAYGNAASSNAQMIVALILGELHISTMPEQLRDNLVRLLESDNAWLNYFIAFDPVECIRKIKCPVIAINGDKDTQVRSTAHLAVIRDNLPWKTGDIVREYQGLNHLFQHCNTGDSSEYIKIEETISPEVLSDIASFVKSLY